MSRGPLPGDLAVASLLSFLRCVERICRMSMETGGERAASSAADQAVKKALGVLPKGGRGRKRLKDAGKALARIASEEEIRPGTKLRRRLETLSAMAQAMEARLPPLDDLVRRGAEGAERLAAELKELGDDRLEAAPSATGSGLAREEGIIGRPLLDALRLEPLETAALTGIHAAISTLPTPPEAQRAVRFLTHSRSGDAGTLAVPAKSGISPGSEWGRNAPGLVYQDLRTWQTQTSPLRTGLNLTPESMRRLAQVLRSVSERAAPRNGMGKDKDKDKDKSGKG